MEQNQEAYQGANVIHPHPAVAIITCLMGFLILGVIGAAGYYGLPYTEFGKYNRMVPAGCLILCGLFTFWSFKNYSNTYLKIDEDGILYKKGWIPSSINASFWINIKDVDSGSKVSESLFGCGFIVLLIAARDQTERVTINWIPKHQQLFEDLREKVGKQSNQTRQVSFT